MLQVCRFPVNIGQLVVGWDPPSGPAEVSPLHQQGGFLIIWSSQSVLLRFTETSRQGWWVVQETPIQHLVFALGEVFLKGYLLRWVPQGHGIAALS